VEFQDYYKTLEVSRDASEKDITKAYRSLARKYHPDISKEPNAEDKFKQLNEAHEVLKDPESRKRYDALGQNWKAGQQFSPPPNWEDMFGSNGGGDSGGFSDFFNSLFQGGSPNAGGGQFGQSFGRRGPRPKGADAKTELFISLEDAYSRETQKVTLSTTELSANGVPQKSQKSYQLKIPTKISDGTTVRMAGQGSPSQRGGDAGDLLITIKFKKHPKFWTEDSTVLTNLEVADWQAALGDKVTVETLSGKIELKIPPGAKTGQTFRLRGKGLSKSKDLRGDMHVLLNIRVPEQLSAEEEKLYQQLKELGRNGSKQSS
ncbi:UNVERIFIED_CONTAM: hypothetical protein GTU68_019988, partial [Idotea baltica]|nr:hypothetical protein [Idotea baltica]